MELQCVCVDFCFTVFRKLHWGSDPECFYLPLRKTSTFDTVLVRKKQKLLKGNPTPLAPPT